MITGKIEAWRQRTTDNWRRHGRSWVLLVTAIWKMIPSTKEQRKLTECVIVEQWWRLEKHMLALKAERRPLQMYYISGTEDSLPQENVGGSETHSSYLLIQLIRTPRLFHYSSVLSDIFDSLTLFHPRLCRSYTHTTQTYTHTTHTYIHTNTHTHTHNENRVHRSIPI